MPLLQSQKSRNERLRERALSVLLERLIGHTTDAKARTLVEAWLAGGSIVTSSCIETPGPLREAWSRKGDQKTFVALTQEFTFPMMSRWFRFVRGALDGPPARRLRTREAWTRYVIRLYWSSDLDKRLAIRVRLDSLFNNDCEANMQARVSPSAIGTAAPNSLSPAEAADMMENHLGDLGTSDESSSSLAMSVMKGGVSVSEPYMLGLRALGLCGRLQRLNPRWDKVASTPVRPSAKLARALPSRVWSLSGALLLIRPLRHWNGSHVPQTGGLPH